MKKYIFSLALAIVVILVGCKNEPEDLSIAANSNRFKSYEELRTYLESIYVEAEVERLLQTKVSGGELMYFEEDVSFI